MWYFAGAVYIFLVCALYCMVIADAKGYDPQKWFVLGLATNIFGLIAIVGMPNNK